MIVNTARTATRPGPNSPAPKASRWPDGFWDADATSRSMIAEHCRSIDDFIADRRTWLVSKFGWR